MNPYDTEAYLQEDEHHYYGHVQDLRGWNVDVFFKLPFYVLGLTFLVVTGLWPLLLLGLLIPLFRSK